MDKNKTKTLVNRGRNIPVEPDDAVKENRFSRYNFAAIITESALVGCSLFLAFLLQQMHFAADGRRFLVGEGEIIRMSLGIAFCYAFIYVLRRGYRWGLNPPEKETAKRLIQYIIETYVLYLALLFLANDINFTSAKLAVGISAVTSAVLLFSFSFACRSIRKRGKPPLARRKITLKKPPYPEEPEISLPAGEHAGIRKNAFYDDRSKTGELVNDGLTKDPAKNQCRPDRYVSKY